MVFGYKLEDGEDGRRGNGKMAGAQQAGPSRVFQQIGACSMLAPRLDDGGQPLCPNEAAGGLADCDYAEPALDPPSAGADDLARRARDRALGHVRNPCRLRSLPCALREGIHGGVRLFETEMKGNGPRRNLRCPSCLMAPGLVRDIDTVCRPPVGSRGKDRLFAPNLRSGLFRAGNDISTWPIPFWSALNGATKARAR
jgi:hypothetical protein